MPRGLGRDQSKLSPNVSLNHMRVQEGLRSLKPDLRRQNSDEQMATLRAVMLSQSPASHAVHANKTGLGLASTHKKSEHSPARTRGRATFKSKSVAPTGDDDKILEKLLKKNDGIGLKQDDMAAKIRDSLEEKDYSMHYLSPRCKAVDESSRLPQEKLDRVVREVNYMSKQLLADIK